jgi:tRNA(Arg) A34 adenosine deaminase TadA
VTAKHKITAVITDRRGRVLSIGQNSYIKTHPYQAKIAKQVGHEDKIFLHAEIHAITRCKDLTKAHKISIFRYDKRGNPVLAKPCNICKTAIDVAGIQHIFHT